MSNNTEALTKRERKFLHPAVVLGQEIYLRAGVQNGFWGGDCLMPVKVGKMTESLIKRGYLERSFSTIRATKKAKELHCKRGNCSEGQLYDDNDEPTGECPDCEDGMRREVRGA